ncbi:MAG: thioredoxin [Candidatus Omnitrophota bacterium]|jgi:thioredoxin 1
MAGHVVEIEEAGFNDNIRQAEGLVMVDFWAPWCGPCRVTAPILESIAEKLQGKVKIYKINIDNCHTLAVEFGVMSIPTMIIFKDGKEQDRIIGASQEAFITQKIEGYIG